MNILAIWIFFFNYKDLFSFFVNCIKSEVYLGTDHYSLGDMYLKDKGSEKW